MANNDLLPEILKLQGEVIENQESDDLEFKSAKGGFPGNFWDTYSAFANTVGGSIVLGIKENNGRFTLDHLSDELIIKYKKQFWNDVNNKSTVNRNICKNDDVKEFDIQGNKVIVFRIPRASYEERPIYRGQNPYGGTFKRNYEGDYKCTESEIHRMYAEADMRVSADMRILKHYTINDIDLESLHQYRQIFQTSNPNHPWVSDLPYVF